MLRLDDRLQIAMSNGVGVQLTAEEVTLVAGWLVALRKIKEQRVNNGASSRAATALGKYAE